MLRPGSKGVLKRHILKAGCFECDYAYFNMYDYARSSQVLKDDALSDPRKVGTQGGLHFPHTPKGGHLLAFSFSGTSGPYLGMHRNHRGPRLIGTKPACSGYTRLTCPHFRAGALADFLVRGVLKFLLEAVQFGLQLSDHIGVGGVVINVVHFSGIFFQIEQFPLRCAAGRGR